MGTVSHTIVVRNRPVARHPMDRHPTKRPSNRSTPSQAGYIDPGGSLLERRVAGGHEVPAGLAPPQRDGQNPVLATHSHHEQ
jgi:hypothetical protein